MTCTVWTPNTYPPARRSDHVDIYRSEAKGQVRVPDPYQWLEEYTTETDEWTSAQEAFTRAYLDKNPEGVRLEQAFRASTDYAKYSAPVLYDDDRWYWFHNTGLQAQSVFYRSKDSTLPKVDEAGSTEGEIFFDSNLLSDDGTAALSMYAQSPDGKYFGYGISQSGSDFSTIYVRSTEAPLRATSAQRPAHHEGRLPEEIKNVKFSAITWSRNSKGFFYQRYPEFPSAAVKATAETQGDRNAMLYYHRVGTVQDEDILIHKDSNNPEWMWGIDATKDGKYLVLTVSRDTARKNLLWITDITGQEIGPNLKWNKVIDDFKASYDLIYNEGPLFYLRTNDQAPQYKIVTVDTTGDKNVFKGLIPEAKDAQLSDVTCVNGNKFVIVYKRNVKDEIYIYSNTGEQIIRLAPDFVGAASVYGRQKQSWFFVTMTGFNTPGTIAQYHFERPETERWGIYRSVRVNGLNPDDFEAQQVWYESKDGTKVPMFLIRHKSTKFDGTAPAIQYGYGGFSVSIDPFFSPTILTFLQAYGAILAVPNIRGGGEFGEEWHRAGTREKKGNVFDDFISATQFLVSNKYAHPNKIAINGASNGGLLVAACVNRAPQGTFGAAVAEVGVLDLLKFHQFTIGKAWTSDYGDPSDPHDFDFIFPVSPVHSIPTNRIFPPMILLTADHDDRVVPMHSFKHAATLQHLLPHNPHPLLLRVDKKAGHGAGKSTEQKIKEAADKWGFVAQSLGLEWKNAV